MFILVVPSSAVPVSITVLIILNDWLSIDDKDCKINASLFVNNVSKDVLGVFDIM